MRKFLVPLFSFFLLTLSAVSQAGLLIEPAVGYNFTSKTSTTDKNYSSGDGVGYGGRIGYVTGPYQMGLDYLKSTINMSSGDFGKDINEEELGAFFGFKFPSLFKIYGTYIFSANGDTKINAKNQNLENGSGLKIGVGCTILPFLDVNLDYRKVGFNKDISVDSMMLSLSLPFNLL